MESTEVQEYFENLERPRPGKNAMQIQGESPVHDLIEEVRFAFERGYPVSVVVGLLYRIGEAVTKHDDESAIDDPSSPVWTLADFVLRAGDITSISGATDAESLNRFSAKLLERARSTIVSVFIKRVLLDADTDRRVSSTKMFDHPLFVPIVAWLSRQEVGMFSNPRYATPIGSLVTRCVGRKDVWYCKDLTIPGLDKKSVHSDLCKVYLKTILSGNSSSIQVFQRIFQLHEPREMVGACSEYLWGGSDSGWEKVVYGPAISHGADFMLDFYPTRPLPESLVIALFRELWDTWKSHKLSEVKEES